MLPLSGESLLYLIYLIMIHHIYVCVCVCVNVRNLTLHFDRPCLLQTAIVHNSETHYLLSPEASRFFEGVSIMGCLNTGCSVRAKGPELLRHA